MREFRTENEVNQWLEDNYSDLISYIQTNCESDDEMNPARILYGYGGNGHRLYNPILRAAKGDMVVVYEHFEKTNEGFLHKEIQILDQFIMNNSLVENIVLYRYDSVNILKILYLYITRKGKTSIDFGFPSTTLLPYTDGMKRLRERQSFNVLYKYYTNKGVPAVPVKFTPKQSNLKEFEMILAKGIKRKLIKKGFDLKIGLPYFEFELWVE